MNPVIPDEAVIAVVDTALFGCEDGEMLPDDDCSIPVGEFRRLLHDVARPRVAEILAANADPAQPVTDASGNEWIAVTRAGWEAAVAVISSVLYGVVHPMGDSLSQEDAARLVDVFESTVTGPASIEYIASAIGYTKPRVISSAADIRALGKAVRDGDPGACVLLVEEGAGRNGVVWTIGYLHRHETDEAPLMVCVDITWLTDVVTDDGIAGHGPWRVVWSRGVELP